MNAYRSFHPAFEKIAINWKNLRSWPGKHIPELAGTAAGLGGGAWLGNMAYKNAMPNVRSLPRLDQAEVIRFSASIGKREEDDELKNYANYWT